ncbi:MAG TPA: alpha/beta fold hydrolase [Terriglobales bacterium]|jgi:pimeloyl-ACP methyl ester carboxylesterase|nr:alpha/beta fold hydrolase [Terriglobales bacterium]
MRLRRVVAATVFAYLTLSVLTGIFLCEATLHPARRPLSFDDQSRARELAPAHHATLHEASIQTFDHITLRAWVFTPDRPNSAAVILVHGLSDNRLGMTGYAELLLDHHYSVLMPDARAHGSSDGVLATYGLVERNDIHQWFDWLTASEHPTCIYGVGESMGAAQLLQSLAVEARFCAVVAESSFSDFREIAYDRVGQFFHTGPWLGRTAFRLAIETAFAYGRWKYHLDLTEVSPETAVASSQVPVLLIHGIEDRNIPVRHSRRIAARNPKVVLWQVPNADHCGALSTAPGEFERELLQWFASTTANRAVRTEN